MRSGCAHGVDTLCVLVALAVPGVLIDLVVPAAPHNHELVAMLVDGFGSGRVSVTDLCDSSATSCQREDYAREYMRRNDVLVADPTDELIGFPPSEVEEQRSGTWATIRRAHKANRPVHLYPLCAAVAPNVAVRRRAAGVHHTGSLLQGYGS